MNYYNIKPEPAGTVTRIPDPLVFPFAVFMQNAGYDMTASKNGLLFRKNSKSAKIIGSWKIKQPDYAMSEHCIARFKVFLELYLKQGAYFICNLIIQGNSRLLDIKHQYTQHNYLMVI